MKKTKKDTKKGGNGAHEDAIGLFEPVSGPPTLPLDQVLALYKELEQAHEILDALDLPPGTITERLCSRARRWLQKTGPASQSHPAIEARKILQAAGQPIGHPFGVEITE